MAGIRIAPCFPISDNDEPRIADDLAQAQNGPKEILECLWGGEIGLILRVPDAEGTKPDREQRKFTGHEWVALCDRYWEETYGSSLQDDCRLQAGVRLAESLSCTTRTSNATHDGFWGLIFLDREDDEAAALRPPVLTKFGRLRQSRPTLARFGPNMARIGPASAEFGRIGPHLARIGPISSLAKSGHMWPRSDRLWSNLGPNWSTLVNVGSSTG